MKKWIFIILIIHFTMLQNGISNGDSPKREFRGAWIATVFNEDWPSSPHTMTHVQTLELTERFDELRDAGINAVIFQIRPECDALYESEFEPWSHWLTGTQGEAPNPFYDPLELAIELAHQRGMELHAWFNPYRAVSKTGDYPIDTKHVSVQHPDWILTFGDLKVLDPGLPMVRDYVTNVILDVVRRYDIDGVHFDDYFYPYPPNHITNQDDATFADYSRGFTNRDAWRRDNVNSLIRMVYEGIRNVKPYVKFGVSPFGIWKNGVPWGTTGLDAYNVIYCDAIAWLGEQIVDYIAPQLYWPFGGGQDYGRLLRWWASQSTDRHLYPGQAAYRISSWPLNEMPNQIRLNREQPNVLGSIFFRALYFQINPNGFVDSLKTDFYRYPALVPVMSWKDSIPPNPPLNLRYARLASTGPAGFQWDLPNVAADGDSAVRYVIYRFTKADVQPEDLDDPKGIVLIQDARTSIPPTPPGTGENYYYTVTSLDRNANESGLNTVVPVLPPATPMLASPGNGEPNQPSEVVFSWHYPNNGATYHLQVSTEQAMNTNLIVNETGLLDTFKVITTLNGQETYYWRLKAGNAGGSSQFSNIQSFSTGFPVAPNLVYPLNNMRDVSPTPNFSWNAPQGAGSYRLQVARSLNFTPEWVLLDSSGIADTTFTGIELESNSFHFWRVKAINALGSSSWSETFRFLTADDTDVEEESRMPTIFRLYPNYPNPFNSETTIPFDLPKDCRVVLKIYNALGRRVATVLDQNLQQGHHKVQFSSSDLASGLYFIHLITDDRILKGKMILLK